MAEKRILVVDDEEDIREMLEAVLSSDSREVIAVSDGYEAITMLNEHSFDLIITDLSMPNIDGFDLIETIKEINPEVPFILITAYGSPGVRKEMERLKAHRYLEKPFDVKEIEEAVESAFK